MRQFKTFTWSSKEQCVFTHNVSRPDCLNADLIIGALTDHSMSGIYGIGI
jgi:hypothetical protein